MQSAENKSWPLVVMRKNNQTDLFPKSSNFNLIVTLNIYASLDMPFIPGILKKQCFQYSGFYSFGGSKAPHSCVLTPLIMGPDGGLTATKANVVYFSL